MYIEVLKDFRIAEEQYLRELNLIIKVIFFLNLRCFKETVVNHALNLVFRCACM